MEIIFEEIYDSKFEGALYISADQMLLFAQKSRGHIYKQFIEDRIALQMFGMSFSKNHKFYETFDRKLQEIFEAGVVGRHIRTHEDYANTKRYAHLYQRGPKVLTLEHLEAGFVICLVPLSFAIIAFIFEWIIKIVEYTISKNILQAMYQRKICTTFRIARTIIGPLMPVTSSHIKLPMDHLELEHI